ncbi:MAG: DUF4399 domain-containing protein [Chitinophagaceae bacterium]|jgi:hypothetical protein|nr:DUF4399 domain-containing protein [Chitinophagaceae bacterium]OQY94754.1 MAG: hypothetical protein B6D37_07825 [Sphingobacteriales bacterium UTBCD1]
MTSKLFLAAAGLFILSACNSSGKGSEKSGDTASKVAPDSTHNMNMQNTSVPEEPSVPQGAKVYFKNLKTGATVSSPFKVQMGVDKMKVEAIGPVVAGSGHFHIFIDAEDSLAFGTVVPTDSTHLHYGKGQSEAELSLAPGKHKLTLQFADGIHRSYGAQLATTVNVTVKK